MSDNPDNEASADAMRVKVDEMQQENSLLFKNNGALHSKLDAANAMIQTLMGQTDGLIVLDPKSGKSGVWSPTD